MTPMSKPSGGNRPGDGNANGGVVGQRASAFGGRALFLVSEVDRH